VILVARNVRELELLIKKGRKSLAKNVQKRIKQR